MKALSIVGYKNTGKTTLAKALGEELARRGIKAAAAKFSHHDSLDKEGTDTAVLLETYGTTVAMTDKESAVFWKGKKYLPDLLPLLDAEVLIVEGGKTLGWLPRVMLLRSVGDAAGLEQGLALASYGDVKGYDVEHLSDVAALADLVLEKGFVLPGLDCGSCGREDCPSMARDIVAGKATPEDCKAMKSHVSVSVNGQPMAMNDFTGGVFAGAIRGMLEQLKGYAPGEIEISIKE